MPCAGTEFDYLRATRGSMILVATIDMSGTFGRENKIIGTH
jgi:hypothetical protein